MHALTDTGKARLETFLEDLGAREWLPAMDADVAALVRAADRQLVRAVWRWQRARAKQLGYRGVLKGGAVGFLQFCSEARCSVSFR